MCISTNVIYVSSNDFDIKPNERVNQASILNEALVPVFALKESLPLSHKTVHIYLVWVDAVLFSLVKFTHAFALAPELWAVW